MPEYIHQSVDIGHVTLNTEHTAFYGLSIHLAMDGLSFCVLDITEQKYVALLSYKLQSLQEPEGLCKALDQVVNRTPWLTREFKNTKIVIETPYYTLIPSALYQKESTETYLQFVNPPPRNFRFSTDHLPNLDAVTVYGISENLIQNISNKFIVTSFHHFSSVLIESLLMNFKNKLEGPKVFVHIRRQNFDLIIMANQKLRLINTYHYRTKEDFAFYLMYALEQSGLNPEFVELIFLGEILKESELFEISQRYIRHISFIKNINWVKYTPPFEEVPLHFYYTLLNLQLCEL